MIAVVAFIVYVERSERRIPVQYAKRIVGRRLMGGQSTHLPLKVNSGGVMPVIFASSILSAPLLFANASLFGYSLRDSAFFGPILRNLSLPVSRGMSCSPWWRSSFSRTSTSPSSSVLTTSPTTCASTADSSPAFVLASALSNFINDVLTRITLVGALYLIIIWIIPTTADQRYSFQSYCAHRPHLR